MSSTTSVTPIRKSITVAAPPEQAFETFTAGMTRWWNPQYSIGSAPLVEVVIEPREGGRWFEQDADGNACEWGRVVTWDPPHRVVLAWQITAGWQFDPALHTELDVRFTAEGASHTRVELEHRGLDNFGSDAATIRAIFDAPDGWQGLLERFADSA